MIQTGILEYNEQLPIPTGFKEEECIWIVSAKTLHQSWQGSARNFLRQSYCLIDDNRRNISYSQGDYYSQLPIYYMVIAKRNAKLKGTSPRILQM